MILFIHTCMYTVSRSVVLIPRTILSTCPGDEILVKCTETESDIVAEINLRWTVTLTDRYTPPVEMSLSDDLRNETTASLFIDDIRLNFSSKLTSYSPLVGIIMTTAHSLLNNAMVTCEYQSDSTSSDSTDSLSIRVLETGKKLIYFQKYNFSLCLITDRST